MLRRLRVAPVWNQNVPSSHTAPTGVTCGLPSSLIVDSQVVRELWASGAGAAPDSNFSTTACQSATGSPSALPRLVTSMTQSLRRGADDLLDAVSGKTAGRTQNH